MTKEEAYNQLASLIGDRESFLGEDDEIYRADIEACKIGMEALRKYQMLRELFVEVADEFKYTIQPVVIECCPHCNNEVTITWSIEEDGHSLFCPYCGKRIMLCSECPVRDNEFPCDWHESKNNEPVCSWDTEGDAK